MADALCSVKKSDYVLHSTATLNTHVVGLTHWQNNLNKDQHSSLIKKFINCHIVSMVYILTPAPWQYKRGFK